MRSRSRVRTRSGLFATPTLLLYLILPAAAAAQEPGLAITGHIRDSTARPIAAAVIEVFGLDSRTSVTAQSNSDGAYTIYLSKRESGYRVSVRRIGFEPAIALVQPREGTPKQTVDFTLGESAFELSALLVEAGRSDPSTPGESPGIGAIDANALRRAALTANPADLEALAGLLPGVIRGDSGVSVLGISPSGNNTLLNGVRFGGALLPPDAMATVRVATTSFDPSLGEFSGALTTIETRSGTDVWRGNVQARLAPGGLTWADPRNTAPTRQSAQLSGYVAGPILRGRLHYLIAGLADRSFVRPLSLPTAPASALTSFGVSPDSLAALTTALERAGIPIGTAAPTADQTDAVGSAQIDLRLSPTTTARFLGIVDRRERSGLGVGPLTIPTIARTTTQDGQRWSAALTSYQSGAVFKGQASAERRTKTSGGTARLPYGSVPVGATTPEGLPAGTRFVSFGGAAGSVGHRSSHDITVRGTLEWTPPASRHELSAGLHWQRSTARFSEIRDPFGRYEFQDLDGLGRNLATRYTRVLGELDTEAAAISWAAWFGDTWSPWSGLRVQGGLRVDGMQPQTVPAINPHIRELFDLRTDQVPGQVSPSPRLGFEWRSARARAQSDTSAIVKRSGNRMGASLPVDRVSTLLEMTDLNLRPWVTVSGGYGVFRSRLLPQAAQLAGLQRFTGLSGSATTLECLGPSVPATNWAGGGAAPVVCGAGGSLIADPALPTIHSYASDYRSPARSSANLSVTGLRLRGWALGVNLVHAWYTLADAVDLNLRRTPAFRLATEGGRPIFGQLPGIDPTSGVVGLGATRLHPGFGRVQQIGVLHGGRTTEIQAQLLPPPSIYRRIQASLNYVRSAQSTPVRGADGISDDPLSVAVRHRVRHQLLLDAQFKLGWFRLTTQLELISGLPYTPQILGDLDGDGSGGDPAYIPRLDDKTQLAHDINRVLREAPAHAARCVRAQAGSVVRRDSCHGPWQNRVNLFLDFAPPRSLGLGSHLSLSIGLTNAGAALQRILGVQPGTLSSDPPPDPTLLIVGGFDPARQKFMYRTNGGFGSPIGGSNVVRPYPTFGLQLRGTWRFGGPSRDRLVKDLGLGQRPGMVRWTPATALAHLRQLFPDPAASVLAAADSLGLSSSSRDSVLAIGRAHNELMDAILAPVTQVMVSRQRRLIDADITAMLFDAQSLIEQVNEQAVEQLEAVLTGFQREKLRLLLLRGAGK